MSRHPVVKEEEEQMREREWSTHLGEKAAVAAMEATAAHVGRTTAPGQAKPGHDRAASPAHQGGAHGGAIAPGVPVSGESPHRNPRLQQGWGRMRKAIKSRSTQMILCVVAR
jgi:hypothetical protein